MNTSIYPQFHRFAVGQGYMVASVATTGTDWFILRQDNFRDDGAWESSNFRVECDHVWTDPPEDSVIALFACWNREQTQFGRKLKEIDSAEAFINKTSGRGVLWCKPNNGPQAITTKIEFDTTAAKLSGRMVSLDAATRQSAAADAAQLLSDLPKHLKNSPHIKGEVEALNTLIARVSAEYGTDK